MLDKGIEDGIRATLSDIYGDGWPILLGIHALQPVVEPVVYIEREAFAASVLVARMEEKALAPAPLWDDVCTFDARPWRGLVDLVAGGTPCQDLSLAGKRAGLDGSRSRLFFEHVRIAVECEAPFFFWENVAGATRVVPRVCEYLEERGYRGAWTVVRASDVGAPHQRARVFLLAYSERFGRLQGWAEPEGERWGSDAPQRGGAMGGGEPVANAARLAEREPHHHQRAEPRQRARGDIGGDGVRLGEGEPLAHANDRGEQEPSWTIARQRGRAPDGGAQVRGQPLAHGQRSRLEVGGRLSGNAGQEQPAAERGRDGLGPFPPGRIDIAGWARVLAVRPDLAPALPQPRVRGVADGVERWPYHALRVDRLRACGNGVVPAQAAHAFRGLWHHLFGET